MGVKEYNFLIKGLSKILNLNEKIDLNDKKKESIEQLIVENRSVNDDLRDDLRAVRIRLNKVKKELEELENISVEDKINKLKELQNPRRLSSNVANHLKSIFYLQTAISVTTGKELA